MIKLDFWPWAPAKIVPARLKDINTCTIPCTTTRTINYAIVLTYLTYCVGDVSSTRISSSSMDLLQKLLSYAMWIAACRSTFIIWQSSFITSIHLFFGLPRLLLPWTRPCMTMLGNLFWLILTSEILQASLLNPVFNVIVPVQSCLNLWIS